MTSCSAETVTRGLLPASATKGIGAVDARLSPDGASLFVDESAIGAVAAFAVSSGGNLTELGRGVMMLLERRLRRDIACQQAVELVTGYLEGTLARAGHHRFEAHLADCPHCTEYLAQMSKTIELTGSVTPDDLTRRRKTSSSRR